MNKLLNVILLVGVAIYVYLYEQKSLEGYFLISMALLVFIGMTLEDKIEDLGLKISGEATSLRQKIDDLASKIEDLESNHRLGLDGIVERLDEIADSLPDRWRNRRAEARVESMESHYRELAKIPLETRLHELSHGPEDKQKSDQKKPS